MAKAFDKYLASDSNLFISDAKNTGTLGDTEMHFLRQGSYEGGAAGGSQEEAPTLIR